MPPFYITYITHLFLTLSNISIQRNTTFMIDQKTKESENIQRYYFEYYPANIYLLKVHNRNTRKRCEIYSNLAILLLTFNIFHTFFYCSYC